MDGQIVLKRKNRQIQGFQGWIADYSRPDKDWRIQRY